MIAVLSNGLCNNFNWLITLDPYSIVLVCVISFQNEWNVIRLFSLLQMLNKQKNTGESKLLKWSAAVRYHIVLRHLNHYVALLAMHSRPGMYLRGGAVLWLCGRDSEGLLRWGGRSNLNRNRTAFPIMRVYVLCVFLVDKKSLVVGDWFLQCGSTNEWTRV